MKVENVSVTDIDQSIRASKFPMATDLSKPTSELTNTVVKLATSGKGEGHDNFLVGMRVSFDLTFTNKAWVEAERYHFFDIVSSQSTMHRISKMDIGKCCNEYVDHAIIQRCEALKEVYLHTQKPEDYLVLLYNIPSGFEITARITTNYRQLKTIYAQRRTHRLPEWREFCEWIKTLPYSELITGEK